MKQAALFPLLAGLLILGAGCQPPSVPQEAVEPQPVEQLGFEKRVAVPGEVREAASLCLKFSNPYGFAAWVKAYGDGEANASALAANISLPEQADQKLIEDIGKTKADNVYTRFFCVLDAERKTYVWSSDITDPEAPACKSTFTVRTDGTVTTSEIETKGKPESCDELCKPTMQTDALFVWQCDLRTQGTSAEWSELRMDRATGKGQVFGCIEDENGVTEGCVK